MKEPENRIEQYRSGKEDLLAGMPRHPQEGDLRRVRELWTWGKPGTDRERQKEKKGPEHPNGKEGPERRKEKEKPGHRKERKGLGHPKEKEELEHRKETEEPERRRKGPEGHRKEAGWIMTAICPAGI